MFTEAWQYPATPYQSHPEDIGQNIYQGGKYEFIKHVVKLYVVFVFRELDVGKDRPVIQADSETGGIGRADSSEGIDKQRLFCFRCNLSSGSSDAAHQ